MDEMDFVNGVAAKQKAKLVADLKKIDRKGGVGLSCKKLEVYWLNGLVQDSPPRGDIKYNNYKLSAMGAAMVAAA